MTRSNTASSSLQKTFLLHHVPKSAHQDTWAVSFSLPYIATEYARAGDGVWYVKTWLTAEQIGKRLAILFDDTSELRIHELSRKEQTLLQRLAWMPGRLEDDDPTDIGAGILSAPRFMWDVLQSALHSLSTAPVAAGGYARAMAASSGNSRAA